MESSPSSLPMVAAVVVESPDGRRRLVNARDLLFPPWFGSLTEPIWLSAPEYGPADEGEAGPVIWEQPLAVTMVAGGCHRFDVVAGTRAGLKGTYQWRKNGVPVAGAHYRHVTVGNVQDTDAGDYDVVVSDSSGSTVSKPARLRVVHAPTVLDRPGFETSPGSVRAGFAANAKGPYQWSTEGWSFGWSTEATLSVAGDAPISYQWWKNGQNIPGATRATLAITRVEFSDRAHYGVTVTNPHGGVVSLPITLVARSASDIRTLRVHHVATRAAGDDVDSGRAKP